jgi:DNA polymerase III subunit alpha
MSGFVHLHLHSAYSLAEGAIHLKALAKLCVGEKMPAVAVTDTNNLFGALEASEILAEAGVQSITGLQLAIDPNSLDMAVPKSGYLPHLVLLAQNEQGYKNLMALSSAAFLTSPLDGYHCCDLQKLLDHSEGVICLTGGRDGVLSFLLKEGRADDAKKLTQKLADSFSNRLYVELQRHKDKAADENALLSIAYDLNLPLVATNEPFFPARDDYEAHDALLCIAEGAYIHQDDRRKVTPEHYFKSAAEMTKLFADLPEAIENTIEIAKRCAFRPRTHAPILPNFANGGSEADELKRQAKEGLKLRLQQVELATDEEDYWQRLDIELDIINRMGFPGYFLIVADFIQWAKGHDIPVGPGRGSGAGSVVAWALTITDLDPLRFGLLFERFLNPERVSMPDFDIDFCQDRRDEVITYVQEKYGRDRVAQIITFGKLQARAVLRDVGRVLHMPYMQVDRICKLVPSNPANPVTLAEAIATEPKLREERDSDEQVAALLQKALKLEGLYRHASTHAAGVVIGDRPLQELVPLYLDPRSDMPATQFNMKWVEPAGLVKFDFLGLKTLTVIQRALALIKQTGIDIDMAQLPVDDKKTFEMLGEGAAIGVFQLESTGMRATLRSMKPDTLEDIIALVSLYRPGPMENIPEYIERKYGRSKPDYLHPKLEEVLKETYGVIIYQEQVMQIAQILSGYSLGDADLLRRAMGKKKKEEMDKQRKRFVEGADANGVDTAKAEHIFDLVAKFAGYGFNKSHAAAYALIAYQTAWLKANHTAEFLAASMSLDMTNTDKLAVFMKEAKRCKIEVLPPDVNASGADFTVEDGKILYALAAIKNVGAQAMGHIEEVRREGGPFKDIFDFAERVDGRQIGKRGFENLARAGAFDKLLNNRAQIMANVEFLVRYSVQAGEERNSAQKGLFADEPAALHRPPLKLAEQWVPLKRLDEERGAIGFYFSGHPLDDYIARLDRNKHSLVSDVEDKVPATGRVPLYLAGVIRNVNQRRSKAGKPFAWVEISDPSGELEITVFSELLSVASEHLVPGTLVWMTVSGERRDGVLRFTGEGVRPLDAIAAPKGTGLRIEVTTPEAIEAVKRRLYNSETGKAQGRASLVMFLPEAGCEVEIFLPKKIAANPAMRSALKVIEGVSSVELV